MNLIDKITTNANDKNFEIVLKNYSFTNDDSLKLKSVKRITLIYTKKLLQGFYEFIFKFEHAKKFLHNKEILARHEKGIENWYLNLFCGEYNKEYFEKLNFISEIHVRIGLPPHYVNTAFSFVRGFVKDILIQEKKYEVLSAWDKIIDINLDFLTITYREEEQSKLLDSIFFLKSVVESFSIEPFVQPIFDAKTLKVNKYESLMRLKDIKENKYLSVFPYLDISKKIKVYDQMMNIMIDKSFNLFDNTDFEFSLNLSYEDITDNSFRNYIYSKIQNYSKSENIIFEILESDFIKDFSIVIDFVKTVREYGCKIAIDDFGSGYSNMENILKLKPELIKIDGSLIKDIDTSDESKTIVKNVVNMAKELNAKTVAEYIHCKSVYDVVISLDVDYLQGFYLGEPKPFNEKVLFTCL